MKLAKIMKPSSFGKEKNETDGRSRVPSVSFFFPDRNWRFHNFMPVSLHETINQFHFLEAKKSENHSDSFVQFSRENCATIKIKNK